MIHFFADVHLSPLFPGVVRLFIEYLAGPARQAEALYILGDLFEAWVGDDDDDACHRTVIGALKAAVDVGVSVNIQHGNRDFLLGERFAADSGARLLPDPFLLVRPGRQFVVSHGDALNTADLDYQSFRRQVRSPAWQSAFLAKPLAERRALAAHLRQQSEQYKRDKDYNQLELDEKAIEELIRSHGYATFIHGHTHRPDRHLHLVDAVPVERWVLADWSEERGEVLVWDGTVLRRQALI